MGSRVPGNGEPAGFRVLENPGTHISFQVPRNREPTGFRVLENPRIHISFRVPGFPRTREPDGFPDPGNPELTWVPGSQERNRKLTPLVGVFPPAKIENMLVFLRNF